MKYTAKRTHIIFVSNTDKQDAIDFLLSVKLPFESTVNKPYLSVAPSNYIKGYLDLYLPNHIAFTHFNLKH